MDTIIYTIADGDTLWNLAEQFGTTVNDIIRFNRIQNPDELRVGQIIRIPVIQVEIPRWYVVQNGDSVYQIAKRFDIPIDMVIEYNNLSNPDLIFPGQVLRLK